MVVELEQDGIQTGLCGPVGVPRDELLVCVDCDETLLQITRGPCFTVELPHEAGWLEPEWNGGVSRHDVRLGESAPGGFAVLQGVPHVAWYLRQARETLAGEDAVRHVGMRCGDIEPGLAIRM